MDDQTQTLDMCEKSKLELTESFNASRYPPIKMTTALRNARATYSPIAIVFLLRVLFNFDTYIRHNM